MDEQNTQIIAGTDSDDKSKSKTKKAINPVKHELIRRRIEREIQLRVSGFSYLQIVAAIKLEFTPDQLPPGYSDNNVSHDIAASYRRMDEIDRETLRVARRMDLQRLDAMMMVTFNRALAGDLKAVNATLQIMERRARLLGLDKPSVVQTKDWRSEVLDLLRAGKVTINDIRKEYGTDIAREVIESGGETVVESYFIEQEDSSSDPARNVPVEDEEKVEFRIPPVGRWTTSEVSPGATTVLGESETLDDHVGGEPGGKD